MTTTMTSLRRRFLAGGLAAFLAAAALAGAADSALSKAVPADVDFFRESIPTAEDDFLDAHWARVHAALERSGFVDAALGVLRESLPDDAARAQFDTQYTAIRSAVDGIPWGRLGAKGSVTAFRFPGAIAPMPSPSGEVSLYADLEVLVALQSDTTTAGEGLASFRRLFEKFAALSPGQLKVTQADASTVSLMTPSPFRVSVAQRGEYIVLSIGSGRIGTQALQLLDGKGDSTTAPLVESERFRSAFAGLPEPERSRVFFDHSRLMGSLKSLTDFGFAMAQMGAEQGTPQAEAIAVAKTITGRLIRELGCYDTAASVETVDGTRVISETSLQFRPAHLETLFHRAIVSQPGLQGWEQWIPADAENFSVNSGANIPLVLGEVRSFLGSLPGGGEVTAVLDQAETSATLAMGFNPIRDALPLLKGSGISVTGRPLAPNTPPPVAMLMPVTDGAKASEYLNKALDMASAAMAQQGQPLAITPRPELGPNLKAIVTPMFMMMGAPQGMIVGVEGENLVVASSPDLLKAVFETKAGTRPNITATDRWRQEGFVAGTAPIAAGYQDMGNLPMQLSAAIQSMSIGALMASAQAPPAVGKTLALLPRLVPVVSEMGFFRGKSTMTWIEDGAWRSRTTTTFAPAD
jgi:hypothetical protein